VSKHPTASEVVTGRVDLVTRSPRTTRAIAHGPRLLAFSALGLLAVAGARTAIAGPEPSPPVSRAAVPMQDLAAQGFAQSFARAYLTWDARRSELHASQVAPYVSQSLDPGAGRQPPESGSQGVLWTAAVQDRGAGARASVITVAAQTTRSLVHLAVPVQRDDRGFMVVPRYPSIVGPPVSDPAQQVEPEDEVEDGALRAVARRTVTNYVERERDNLRADLDRAAVVSLPSVRLEVRAVQSVTWAAPRRVAVTVTAEDTDGTSSTLRYELSVVRRDRWYVRAISTDPTSRR
jgi:hypothetical protein